MAMRKPFLIYPGIRPNQASAFENRALTGLGSWDQ